MAGKSWQPSHEPPHSAKRTEGQGRGNNFSAVSALKTLRLKENADNVKL